MASSPPAPVNNLPTEVLSSIFKVVVNASLYARSIGNKSYGPVDCSTLLASVCAHWRQVAIGIPSLWSYIDFTRNSDTSGNLEHAGLYLERSQDSPVYIHLGKFLENDDERRLMSPTRALSEDIQSLLRILAPRLRSLALNFSHPQDVIDVLLIIFSQGFEYTLPELALGLQPFRLLGGPRRDLILEKHWSQYFRWLNSLHIQKLPISSLYLSCRNLTELYLTSISVARDVSIIPTLQQIMELLTSNPNLHTIKLSGSDFRIPTSFGTQSIHLPVLRRLELGSIDETFINWLLGSLVLGPHGLKLYLKCSGMKYIADQTLKNTIVAFFQRTSVVSLHISGRWIRLPPILPYLPRLQRLGLTVYDFEEGTLDGIEDAASTLTNLHTIELKECHLQDGSALDRGLKTLLTLPSIRQIRHFRCGSLSRRGRERFHQRLSEDQDITARVVQAPELGYEMYSSPFL
ncbi:hypothetical protein FRC09_013668 [Ceratobasidium sp. 395]|nr:hypothetical protein FRC09_013668 [Ceratobasidium sp. 395]